MLRGKKYIGSIGYLGGIMALPEPFVWSWSQMVEYNNDYLVEPNQNIYYNRTTYSYHVYARNSLVTQMRGDWLFMLDTDIQFEPDIAMRMLHCMNKHKIDVLIGCYNFKNSPHSPVLFMFDKSADRFVPLGDWDSKAEIMEIGSAGAGCLMVRKKVFDTIKKELHDGPFDVIHPFSEDHSFFKRLKKLKIKAYFSPNIEVSHLRMQPLTLADYEKDKVIISKRKRIVNGFI